MMLVDPRVAAEWALATTRRGRRLSGRLAAGAGIWRALCAAPRHGIGPGCHRLCDQLTRCPPMA